MKNNIPKPVRVILFTAGVIWIAAMWAKKDIAATLAALPADGGHSYGHHQSADYAFEGGGLYSGHTADQVAGRKTGR